MTDPNDFYEFWHTLIEGQMKRQGLDDDPFGVGLSATLAYALSRSMSTEEPNASPERMLLRLREWYGADVERFSVLAFTGLSKVHGCSIRFPWGEHPP